MDIDRPDFDRLDVDLADLDFGRRRLLAALGAGIAGIGGGWYATRPATGTVTAPNSRPEASSVSVSEYARSINAFTVDVLDALSGASSGENVLFSPASISAAMAMVWAGARGETADEMSAAMQYPFPQDRLHPAIGAFLYDLASRARSASSRKVPAVWESSQFELTIANAVWAQTGFSVRDAYRETLSTNYGTTLRRQDFAADPEAARSDINDWAAGATNDRIDELFPSGSIDDLTRLVLANAVYLLADWAQPFDPARTEDAEFTTRTGDTSTVSMMHQTFSVPALRTETYQMVELPYVGEDVSFVVLVPAEGSFEAVVDGMTHTWLGSRIGGLMEQKIALGLPRFEFEYGTSLKATLEGLGMTSAFDEDAADFTGMVAPAAGGDALFVGDVFHDAYVAVDEQGTEAAAATGVTMRRTSMPPSVTVDRPFLFFIRDRPTNAILFAGRVVDPAAMAE